MTTIIKLSLIRLSQKYMLYQTIRREYKRVTNNSINSARVMIKKHNTVNVKVIIKYIIFWTYFQ